MKMSPHLHHIPLLALFCLALAPGGSQQCGLLGGGEQDGIALRERLRAHMCVCVCVCVCV